MSFNNYISDKKYTIDSNTDKKLLVYDLENSIFKTSVFPLNINDGNTNSVIRLNNNSLHLTGNIVFKDSLQFESNVQVNKINFISENSNEISIVNNNLKFNNNILLKSNVYIETVLTASQITGSLTECSPGEDLIIGGTGCNVRKKVVNGVLRYSLSEGAVRNGRLHNSLQIGRGSIEPVEFSDDMSEVGNTSKITKIELGSTDDTASILKFGKRITLYFDFNFTTGNMFLLDLDSVNLYNHIVPGTTLSIRITKTEGSNGEIYLKCSDDAFIMPIFTIPKNTGIDKQYYFNLLPHDVTKDGITLSDVIVLGKYTSSNPVDGLRTSAIDLNTTFEDITDILNESKSLELIYCGVVTNNSIEYKMWIIA